MLDSVAERLAAYRELNGLNPGVEVPIDAVTASGSGLDPHISPGQRAPAGSARCATSAGSSSTTSSRSSKTHTAGRSLGFLGEPGVNVLELNLALDDRA